MPKTPIDPTRALINEAIRPHVPGPKAPEASKEAQLRAGLAIAAAVLETVREAGSAPEGVLYAALMEKAGFTYQEWEALRGTLLRTGLVRAEANQLHWVGPKLPKT